MNEFYKEVNPPSWKDYFIGLAFMVAEKSKDAETHHGCIIVDGYDHILATGYNSFPREMTDCKLPNIRPHKYPWMKHAEKNALANCGKDLHNAWGVVAYVTGKPCYECLSDMWAFGIEKVVYANTYGWKKDEEEKEQWNYFVQDTGISVEAYTPNLNWVVPVVDRLRKLGFITES